MQRGREIESVKTIHLFSRLRVPVSCLSKEITDILSGEIQAFSVELYRPV